MSVLHALISPVVKVLFTFQSKQKLPQISGKLNVYGLKDDVSVKRDQWGVPHIQASNSDDLFFAQGFVHAQDRLWQMELNRRVANGTLSELFGELTVDTDRLSRTLGFRRLGIADWDVLEEKTQQAITAYIKGINAYLNHLDTSTPVEFGIIKLEPKSWTKDDCLAISRMMIWQMSHAWYGETIRAQLIDAVGEDHASELEIQYRKENPLELPEGIEFNKFVKGQLKKASGPFLTTNQGSNAWAISGQRSKTGKPILANDPHLLLSLPSIWYHNHLRGKELNITGVSIVGLPMIILGHNAHIAWGLTLSFNDCEDLFMEKINPDDDNQYEFKSKWKDMVVIPEIIKVKDGINVQELVKLTDHGPIISDFITTPEVVALQSKSLQQIPSLSGWYRLNYATGWDEFIAGIKLIEAPSLNVVYADEENIGYYNSGKVPVRAKGDGRLPVPGWTGAYEWKSEIPFEEMPHALNPEKGYIISCNNKIVPDNYPHHLGENFMNGFRALRLEQYFDLHETLGIEECKQMQLDTVSTAASLFLAHFAGIVIDDPNPKVKQVYDMFLTFDGNMKPESIPASLYQVTRHMAIRILLEKHLGEELTNTYLGDGLHPVLLPSHEFYGQDISVLLRLLDNESSWWVNQAGGKEKLLQRAFVRAFEWLMDHVGSNTNRWQWGRIHKISFNHAFDTDPIAGRIFSRRGVVVAGDSETPCQMAYGATTFNVVAWAPSWRQIIDMNDVTQSLWMYTPGQSGQLASPHYDDLIKPWQQGMYNSLLWSRGQIENHLSGELILEPQIGL